MKGKGKWYFSKAAESLASRRTVISWVEALVMALPPAPMNMHLEVADRRHGVEGPLVQGLQDQRRVAVLALLHAVVEDAARLEVARLELGQRAVGVQDLQRQVLGIGEEGLEPAVLFLEKGQVQEARPAAAEALHFLDDARLVGQAEVIVRALREALDVVLQQVVEDGRVVLVDDDVGDQGRRRP